MTQGLLDIIRQTMRLTEAEGDWPDVSDPRFARKRSSRAGRYSGYVARRIEPDGSPGELFKVVSTETRAGFTSPKFKPSDPDDPAEYVILQSLERPGNEVRVDYDDYVDPEQWMRGQGSMVSTYPAATAGGKEMNVGDITKKMGATHARGAVAVHPRTGEWRSEPGPQMTGAQSVSRTKIDIEQGLDKLAMGVRMPDMFDQMVSRALMQYKKDLVPSLVRAREAIKAWKIRALSGEELEAGSKLSDEEKGWLKDDPGRVDAALWELPTFHQEFVPSLGIPPQHVSTISSLASRNGSLSMKQLQGDPDADSVINHDPGFRDWLGKSDWWDRLRNALETGVHRKTKKPLRMYRGQW